MVVHVCRKEHFNAAHRLYNPAWSKEKNQEVFGACANEHYHGHNFNLIITVKGEPDPDTACVIDLKVLSKIIKEHICDQVDHQNLNLDVPFLQGKIPSCETLVVEFWKILEHELSKVGDRAKLHCIELFETERNFVRFYGEGE